ncbi:hypothetical protein LshimejAT787_1500680 [Lyophyllum shimeji]|uniref:Uncharacterized protein n=1 Tax=Lyophyllum shimeji TaxID=47721 RepID=A0A9P3UQF9_LYOSH|nr:hypothetical protein LshimejAT787_1500680 [Lyophyllum shimeji]
MHSTRRALQHPKSFSWSTEQGNAQGPKVRGPKVDSHCTTRRLPSITPPRRRIASVESSLILRCEVLSPLSPALLFATAIS